MNSSLESVENVNVVSFIHAQYPKVEQIPASSTLLRLIKLLSREEEINRFLETHQHLRGFAFLDQILEHFNFSYRISAKSISRIPYEGKVLIVANHPIGSLDGLALLKLVRSVRSDAKIVANNLLTQVAPLRSLFLPIDNFRSKAHHKRGYKLILEALNHEEAVIIFPAGEVSRIRPHGVRDGKWKTGFIRLARKTGAPVLPVHISANNSVLFYALSTLYKPLGTALLAKEMFNQEGEEIELRVGDPIPWSTLRELRQGHTDKIIAKKVRKEVIRLGQRKAAKLKTISTIKHPANAKVIRAELKKSEVLGETQDGKTIYLCDYDADSAVIQELGRLRELTFRTVDEGTGHATDLDKYDAYYHHLVLWDEKELDLVGAYRIGLGDLILNQYGAQGFYSASLFTYTSRLLTRLPKSIELGRSFVQPKYWNKRSLDYLWYGIGAYLNRHPEVEYLFGPVSLSAAYPLEAQELIVAFYKHHFGSSQQYALAKRPFLLSRSAQTLAHSLFTADYKSDFKKLNGLLTQLGVRVPTLYKQYSELCTENGCQFLSFSCDPDFNHCIDALILVEVNKIAARKRTRYMGTHDSQSIQPSIGSSQPT